MNDATFMKEFNTREKRSEPFSGVLFWDFNRYKPRMKSPIQNLIHHGGLWICFFFGLHGDESIRRSDDERVERYNGGMRFMF